MHAGGLGPARVAGWTGIIERQLCRTNAARVAVWVGIIERELCQTDATVRPSNASTPRLDPGPCGLFPFFCFFN
jgi:hypothetical protein